ncbi:MAG: hypothetical protein WB919_19790 [Candidatus Sulfotelmatobacter sp.]
MQPKVQINRRQQDRKQGVLPVRVRGKDASGVLFEGLAHTLDLTPTGARLGAIRHQLNALDTLVVLFRQRRVEFTVVWTKKLDAQGEYQVGLQMVADEVDPWGLKMDHSHAQYATKVSAMSGAA